MIGSHASGEAAAHQLMPIEKAYEQAVSASRKEDRLLEGRRQAILSHLRTVDERLEKINQNASIVEERIYRILQEAMTKLQDETQHKLSVLLGEEAELRRQLQQLDWMDAFLEYEKKVLSGFSFLDAWRHHQSLRTYIQQTPVLRSQLDVYPDLKVEGDIRVVTDALIREEQLEMHEVESEKAKRFVRHSNDIPFLRPLSNQSINQSISPFNSCCMYIAVTLQALQAHPIGNRCSPILHPLRCVVLHLSVLVLAGVVLVSRCLEGVEWEDHQCTNLWSQPLPCSLGMDGLLSTAEGIQRFVP
jgi:hypothetical protein